MRALAKRVGLKSRDSWSSTSDSDDLDDDSHSTASTSSDEGGTPTKAALEYTPGQKVKMCSDIDRVKVLQVGHGGYWSGMDKCIGQVGTLVSVDSDGDLTVRFKSGEVRCFNPECMEPVYSSDESSEESDSDSDCADSETATGLQSIRRGAHDESSKGGNRSAEDLKSPNLHTACYDGNESIVKLLASNGADIEEEDENGDRPIHKAVCGNQPGIITLLINLGADINARSKTNCTALHIAVQKEFVSCVRVLTKCGSRLDVNAQDTSRRTPFHFALGYRYPHEIIDLLLKIPGADPTINDKLGFNVLTRAATNGSNWVVERILSLNPDFVNVKETNGYGPLHNAALMNHTNVIQTLLKQRNCIVDLENKQLRTPLMIAARKACWAAVELLLLAGADINKPDIGGNTSMHLTLLLRDQVRPVPSIASMCPAITEVARSLQNDQPGADPWLVLTCFLASKGGDIHRKNKKGITPLHLAKNTQEVKLLLNWKAKSSILPMVSPQCSEVTKEENTMVATGSQVEPSHRCALKDTLTPRNDDGCAGGSRQSIAPKLTGECSKFMKEDSAANGTGSLPEPIPRGNVDGVLSPPTDGGCAEESSQSSVPKVTGECSEITEEDNAMMATGSLVKCSHRCTFNDALAAPQGSGYSESSLHSEAAPSGATAAADHNPVIRVGVCEMCEECPANVRFEPCSHKLYCEQCCRRMKRCLTCGKKIATKILVEEKVLSHAEGASATQKKLEAKVRELEDTLNCGICMERQRNIIFMCGHGSCDDCAKNLQDCHICRRTITNRINVY